MKKKVNFKMKLQKSRQLTCLALALSIALSFPGTLSAENSSVVSVAYMLQQKTVTLNIKNKPIRSILNEIKKQSGIGFMIVDNKTEKELASLSINVSNKSVKEALEQLLAGTSYTYRIVDNVITLEKKTVVVKKNNTDSRIRIEGTVLNDEDRKGVFGATVSIKDLNRGVVADINGKFTLNVNRGDILEITFIGKVPVSIQINDDKPINVVMKNDVMALEDVIVTGFSNVKRSSYTGNAVTVKRDDLLKASKTNVIKALQSFDPSFRIRENNQWGSDPNALPEVNIRGGSSMGAKQANFKADGSLDEHAYLQKSNLKDNPNLPTFIMDGFEISVTKLYDFDPNRIESVTILKDAAATALYGSRAANGVVIITTVPPKPGKINVAYNFVGEFTIPDLSDYHLLNARQKLETERLAGCFEVTPEPNDGQDDYDRIKLIQEYNAKLINIERGVDTYWLSKPLKTTLNHKHSLYVDGGTENLRFGIDLQYNAQDGVMKESYRNRMGAGFFIQYNYKGLSIKNHTSYLGANSQESPYGSFSDFTKQLPYDTYLKEDGSLKPYLTEWSGDSATDLFKRKMNPLYEPSLRNEDKTKEESIINNLDINWNLTDALIFKTQLSVQKDYSNHRRFYDPLSMKNSKPLSSTVLSSGELYLNYDNALSYDFNSTLSYNKTIAEHHMLNLLTGVNVREESQEGHSAFYEGFPSGALSSVNYARQQVGKTSYDDGRSRSVGFLGSINYSYRDIYMFDGSVRVDGSSSFGTEKRFAPFWSAGVGVNIHNYDFMKTIDQIDQIKIRGSYGLVGNVNFQPYESLITYSILSDEWYKTGYGSTLKAFGNRHLKWETTKTLDVGVELMLFDNFLYMKASYYDKKTVDLINNVTIRSSTGFTSYKDNVGEISNRGYELDLRVSILKKKDMSLYLNANLAHNKNKILKISESLKEYNRKVQNMYATMNPFNTIVANPLMQYQEGGSLKSLWGVPSLGINPADGKEIFIDRNGRLTKTWNSLDQVIIGNSEPKGQGSLGLSFTYKQFSFYSSFMYQFGAQVYNQTLVDKVENVSVYQVNVDRRVLEDRWREKGNVSKFKYLTVGRRNLEITKPTSRFIQDYNSISWNSVELSYDMPNKITDKLSLGMLRLTAGMNDVFHFSSVEQERGLSYPYARTFNFSVKISF